MSTTIEHTEVQPILVALTIPAAPYALVEADFVKVFTEIEQRSLELRITTDLDAATGTALLAKLTKFGTTLEAERKRLKAPFLKIEEDIDTAARKVSVRIETAKGKVRNSITHYSLGQAEKARAAEQKRLADIAALEKEQARLDKIEAEKTAKLLAEAKAAGELKPVDPELDFDLDLEPAEPAPKTAIERQIETLKFTKVPAPAALQGAHMRVRLRIKSVDVKQLPEPFVLRTPDESLIRDTYVVGWKDGSPIPECPGVVFEIERTPISNTRGVETF